uniref:DUF5641 domain-containing protein n=1 Tax=Heligmosomoides polygyrus TaxID=6339 RepID=A0A183G4J8_HELPZ
LSLRFISTERGEDPNYLPSNETRALQHREQVMEALNSSSQTTEQFWSIWQQHYLTALCGTCRKKPTSQKQEQEKPQIGDVVLVSDPVLLRNEWRMARKIGTRSSADGEVREVELRTSTRRKMRQPINFNSFRNE